MYSYTNEGWGDLLTAFNGVSFTYDEIGNPLVYNNGNTYNFTWQKGRQLSSATLLGNTYTYKYNQDGIRIEKTVGSKTHIYTLNGTQISRETIKTGNTVVKDIYYYYDASGIISSAKVYVHGDTTVEYGLIFNTNIQGDVEDIYTTDGIRIAKYAYDAWGNITTTYITTDTTLRQLADEAPFRYRGYYYDSETALYYLNTRYYDPSNCRFINADDISYLGANGDLQAYNLYAYCSNNPVMRIDPTGQSWLSDLFDWIGGFFENTFGAKGSKTTTIISEETSIVSEPSPITISGKHEVVEVWEEHGDDSKPISFYANANTTNYVESNAGLKINTNSGSLIFNLAVDDVSVSVENKNSSGRESHGIKLDLTRLKIGYEYKNVRVDGKRSIENSTNVSVSLWWIYFVCSLATTGQAQPVPNGIN